jgi:hypothetical protein
MQTGKNRTILEECLIPGVEQDIRGEQIMASSTQKPQKKMSQNAKNPVKDNTSAGHAIPYSGYHRSTEVAAEDEKLTHVGAGTPCGEYLSRFWLPVALTSQLTDLPLALRVMGEDLVMFRDLSWTHWPPAQGM